MSLTREKIKELAKHIQDIERLEKILIDGFLSETSTRSEYRVAGYFYVGSGIEGSVNQRMWRAQERGLCLLEDEMKKEAEIIIKELSL